MESISSRSASRTKYLITSFRNGIRIRIKKVVEVKVDGIPPFDEDEPYPVPVVKPPETSAAANSPIRIWIDIRMSNGLHLSRKNLSYRELVRMVENLEGLC